MVNRSSILGFLGSWNSHWWGFFDDFLGLWNSQNSWRCPKSWGYPYQRNLKPSKRKGTVEKERGFKWKPGVLDFHDFMISMIFFFFLLITHDGAMLILGRSKMLRQISPESSLSQSDGKHRDLNIKLLSMIFFGHGINKLNLHFHLEFAL